MQPMALDQISLVAIVNKIAMDVRTAKLVRGLAPSTYLQKIQNVQGIDLHSLGRVLRSHDIDPIALQNNDFKSFFNARFESLIQQIERIMGKSVNRGTDGDESPFARALGVGVVDNLERLIASGEGETLEFKSTGIKELHGRKKDPRIEWAVVKSLCGFLNSDGGTLLVGVGDDRSVVGIEHDFPFLRSKNSDGWSRWLMDLVESKLGSISVTCLKLRFAEISGKTVAQVDVKPSVAPIFAQDAARRQVFFVRAGSSTRQLEGSALLVYQRNRFRQS